MLWFLLQWLLHILNSGKSRSLNCLLLCNNPFVCIGHGISGSNWFSLRLFLLAIGLNSAPSSCQTFVSKSVFLIESFLLGECFKEIIEILIPELVYVCSLEFIMLSLLLFVLLCEHHDLFFGKRPEWQSQEIVIFTGLDVTFIHDLIFSLRFFFPGVLLCCFRLLMVLCDFIKLAFGEKLQFLKLLDNGLFLHLLDLYLFVNNSFYELLFVFQHLIIFSEPSQHVFFSLVI